MQQQLPQFHARTVEVFAMCMAQPKHASAFREQFKLTYPLLCDPSRSAYRTFGLEEGSVWQVTAAATYTGKGLRSFLKHGFGRPDGSVRQLGGTFVIDATGTLRFAHRSENSADTLPADELLAIFDGLNPTSKKAEADDGTS